MALPRHRAEVALRTVAGSTPGLVSHPQLLHQERELAARVLDAQADRAAPPPRVTALFVVEQDHGQSGAARRLESRRHLARLKRWHARVEVSGREHDGRVVHALADRLVLGLGVIFVPAYLVQYYYELELTLDRKAYVLMASGLILLAARRYLGRRPWARREEA